MNSMKTTAMQSGPSRIAVRCDHDKLTPATGVFSFVYLFMTKCNFCESRFWTFWDAEQCIVCKRFVHKTCAANRKRSLKGKNSTWTKIYTKTNRAGETARNAAVGGRRDSFASWLWRYVGTVWASIAAMSADFWTTDRPMDSDEKTRGGAEQDARGECAATWSKQNWPGDRVGSAPPHDGEAPATEGRPEDRREWHFARPCRPWNASSPTAPPCRFRPAHGPFNGRPAPTADFNGPSPSAFNRITRLPPIAIRVCIDPPLGMAALSDPAVSEPSVPIAVRDSRPTSGPEPSVPNRVCESSPTESAVRADSPTKHPLAVGPSMMSHISKWPYASNPGCEDPTTRNTVSDNRAPVSRHNDVTTNVIKPGRLHVPAEFWLGRETCKPFPGPPMLNPVTEGRPMFNEPHLGPSRVNSHMGPPTWNPTSKGRPMLNPPHTRPPMFNAPHMGPSRVNPHMGPPTWNPNSEGRPMFYPPHTRPPMFNVPHMGSSIVNPPHIGPPMFNPPHIGPPMYNPAHTGPPMFNPLHIGPPSFNPPYMGLPMKNPPRTGPPVFNSPHMGPFRHNPGRMHTRDPVLMRFFY